MVALATPPLDPIGGPAHVLDCVARLADAGATDLNCVIAARSAEHYCDQLAALAELTGGIR